MHPNISTQPILENDLAELIEFDKMHLCQVMANIGVPADELTIPLTLGELEEAYKHKDQIEWIIVNETTKAGYFWFAKKSDCLFLVGGALTQEFYGLGIAEYVLKLAEDRAKKLDLIICRLAVIPMNGRAIKCYLKQGYYIVKYAAAFFGPEHPNTFRLIMEKHLSEPIKTQSKDMVEVICSDKEQLKKLIDNGFVGVEFIHTKNTAAQHSIIFKSALPKALIK